MKKRLLILAVTSLLTLAGCGGNSAPASEESSSPSSQASVIPSTEYNLYNCVAEFVKEAQKYSKAVTVEKVLKSLAECGEELEVAADSSTKVSEVGVLLALYFTFKDVLPARIGARSFQGFYSDIDKVEFRKVKDDSKNGIVYKALAAMNNFGIYHVPAGTSLSNGKAMARKNAVKYLDRVHAYIGGSAVDDYFSTVNHDYLYDANPNRDCPADGRMSWDEKYDEENLTNIYDSRLIPEETIVDWALPIIEETPSAKNFVDFYKDFDARATGKAAGLVAGIQEYLAATTPEEFLEVCRKQAEKLGFCILWSDASINKYSMTDGTRLWTLECYNYSESSATASANMATSTNRFKPIFQEVLGCDDETALKLATDYSKFKVRMAEYKERDERKNDGAIVITDDEQSMTDNPDTFVKIDLGSTGQTLQGFFGGLGFADKSVLFTSVKDITAIAKMFKDGELDLLKGMAVWQMLQHYTICLPDTEACNAWAWKTGYGTNKETLWDNKSAFYTYGMPYLSSTISNAVTQSAAFDSNANAVVGLLGELKEAMNRRIDASSFSADAKGKAKNKVAAMKYSIGGLNSDGTKTTYDAIAFPSAAEGGNLYKCIGAYAALTLQDAAETAGTNTKGDFISYVADMDPLTANAFYMPSYNGIDITLGYMAAYDGAGEMEKAELLSSYGWVLGHEFSHGFDSNGIYYDEKGERHEGGWFLPDDQSKYAALCKNVADFYDGYEVMPNQATVGKTVLTEAIADINGLHLAMEVAKAVEGFDYKEFFTDCAKNFAGYSSQYTYVAAGLAADEHPFGRARVNRAFSSTNEWHEAYGSKEGDAMYVAPADRIYIW